MSLMRFSHAEVAKQPCFHSGDSGPKSNIFKVEILATKKSKRIVIPIILHITIPQNLKNMRRICYNELCWDHGLMQI